MFTEIMLDIESLGKKPGAAVVSIGACAFSLTDDGIGPTFYCNINPQSCTDHGLHMDADTVMWWMKQSDQARQALVSGSALLLPQALQQLTAFVVGVRNAIPANRKEIGIWGNDNTFDIVLMESAYAAARHATPWSYWESRSVRTLVNLGQRIGFDPKRDMPRTGTAHNALDDAIHQAKYCRAIWSRMTTAPANDGKYDLTA